MVVLEVEGGEVIVVLGCWGGGGEVELRGANRFGLLKVTERCWLDIAVAGIGRRKSGEKRVDFFTDKIKFIRMRGAR